MARPLCRSATAERIWPISRSNQLVFLSPATSRELVVMGEPDTRWPRTRRGVHEDGRKWVVPKAACYSVIRCSIHSPSAVASTMPSWCRSPRIHSLRPSRRISSAEQPRDWSIGVRDR